MGIINSLKIKQPLLVKLLGLGVLGMMANQSTWAAEQSNCKILVLGDSISAAYGLSPEQGWVTLMESKIAQKFPTCKVVNASISGETTSGGKTRLPALLEKNKPTHMIVELGANDGLRGLSLQTMQKNLTDIALLAEKNKVETIFIGMQIPPNYGPSYTQRFQNTFSLIAKQQKTVLVPFLMKGFAENPQAFQADGIHPNAASQKLMLDNVWPYLTSALKTKN